MEGGKLRVALLQNKSDTFHLPVKCTLSAENLCLSPSGPAAGNSRAGRDRKQVLSWFAHSAPQIPALQREGDGSGNTPARFGRRDNRPGTKVSDSSIQRVLLWESSWWGYVFGLNLKKWTLLMAEICILGTGVY